MSLIDCENFLDWNCTEFLQSIYLRDYNGSTDFNIECVVRGLIRGRKVDLGELCYRLHHNGQNTVVEENLYFSLLGSCIKLQGCSEKRFEVQQSNGKQWDFLISKAWWNPFSKRKYRDRDNSDVFLCCHKRITFRPLGVRIRVLYRGNYVFTVLRAGSDEKGRSLSLLSDLDLKSIEKISLDDFVLIMGLALRDFFFGYPGWDP